MRSRRLWKESCWWLLSSCHLLLPLSTAPSASPSCCRRRVDGGRPGSNCKRGVRPKWSRQQELEVCRAVHVEDTGPIPCRLAHPRTLHLLVEKWCAAAFLTSDAAAPGTRTQAGSPLRPDSTGGAHGAWLIYAPRDSWTLGLNGRHMPPQHWHI